MRPTGITIGGLVEHGISREDVERVRRSWCDSFPEIAVIARIARNGEIKMNHDETTPELPPEHRRKKNGKVGPVDWKATAIDRYVCFHELRDAYEIVRTQARIADSRILDLEKKLREARDLATEQSAEIRKSIATTEKSNDALREAAKLINEKDGTIAALRSRIELLLGTITALSRSVEVATTQAPAPTKDGGRLSPHHVFLPWGSPEHTDNREVAPSGPIRTYLLRAFVEVWSYHSEKSKPFSVFAREVLDDAADAYPPAQGRLLSDTNIARRLSERLGKKFPF
jgi:hypothetical protein